MGRKDSRYDIHPLWIYGEKCYNAWNMHYSPLTTLHIWSVSEFLWLYCSTFLEYVTSFFPLSFRTRFKSTFGWRTMMPAEEATPVSGRTPSPILSCPISTPKLGPVGVRAGNASPARRPMRWRCDIATSVGRYVHFIPENHFFYCWF